MTLAALTICACGGEEPVATEVHAPVEVAEQPEAEVADPPAPRPAHGGTMLSVGTFFVEIIVRGDGAIEAVGRDEGFPRPSQVLLTATITGEDGEPHPVVLTWDPARARFRGLMRAARPLPGPIEVKLVVDNTETHRGRSPTVVVSAPPAEPEDPPPHQPHGPAVPSRPGASSAAPSEPAGGRTLTPVVTVPALARPAVRPRLARPAVRPRLARPLVRPRLARPLVRPRLAGPATASPAVVSQRAAPEQPAPEQPASGEPASGEPAPASRRVDRRGRATGRRVRARAIESGQGGVRLRE